MRHYRARSTEERRIRRKYAKSLNFLTSCGEYVNLRYIAMLYIHLFDWKSAIEHYGGV